MNLDHYKNIEFVEMKSCSACGSQSDQEELINLRRYPITEVFVNEQPKSTEIGRVDQSFLFCQKCHHGQLSRFISPSVLYGDADCYNTRTSNSPSAMYAIEVFLNFCEPFLQTRKKSQLLEVGCNDLHMLSTLKDSYSDIEDLIGIDPIFIDRNIDDLPEKVRVIGDYIENLRFGEKGLDPDVVISSHTLEHITDPKTQIDKLITGAKNQTIFLFQFPSLEQLVHHCRFEQIHHQHLHYFSIRSFQNLLQSVGAELIEYSFNPFHWGAMMVAFQKRALSTPTPKTSLIEISSRRIQKQNQIFLANMNSTADRLQSLRNERIYGFGAANMLPILDYYASLLPLTCILDDNKEKNGKYFLNVDKEIKHTSEVDDLIDSNVLVTAPFSKLPYRGSVKRLIDMKVKNIILPTQML